MERHATRGDTVPDPDCAGGEWVALCLTCGWEKAGQYRLDAAEPTALRLAHLQGSLHETTELKKEAERRG